MKHLTHYGLVRIIQLQQALENYDGWEVNRRPPQIGDLGTVIDILHAPEQPAHYIVESSDREGITIWLGDFDAEELEPIDDAEYTPQSAEPKASNSVQEMPYQSRQPNPPL
jgi:hypothetical protein